MNLLNSECGDQLLQGAVVGIGPTVCMLFMSLWFYKVEVSKAFEAMAQNLCAGLILGAVGKELFPQLGDFDHVDDVIGLTIGFLCGILLINYQESIEVLCESFFSWIFPEDEQQAVKEAPKHDERKRLLSQSNPNYQSNQGDDNGDSEFETETDIEENDHPILLLGTQVISSPAERSRVHEKVTDLVRSINSMQSKAQALFTPSTSLTSSEAEILADQIDEEIHRLHYYLDHCRRYCPSRPSP